MYNYITLVVMLKTSYCKIKYKCLQSKLTIHLAAATAYKYFSVRGQQPFSTDVTKWVTVKIMHINVCIYVQYTSSNIFN